MYASKTPEQIAADTARPDALDCPMCGIRHPYIAHWPCAGAFDDARVVAAIEADRAQLREVKAQAWREGWDASERFGYLDGVLETPLNPYLEADDDEEPTSADERDYGKYLDQQFWGDH